MDTQNGNKNTLKHTRDSNNTDNSSNHHNHQINIHTYNIHTHPRTSPDRNDVTGENDKAPVTGSARRKGASLVKNLGFRALKITISNIVFQSIVFCV